MMSIKLTFKHYLVVFQTAFVLLMMVSGARAAGEIDPTFNGGVAQQPIRNIFALKRQNDGKILVGGNFEVANGALRYGIVRLNADSTVDQTFNPPDTLILGVVRGIDIQPDGKIVIAGNMVVPVFDQSGAGHTLKRRWFIRPDICRIFA